MPTETNDRETVYDDLADEQVPEEPTDDVMGDQPANNGVSALYAHAQALLDAANQLAEDLKATDNPDIYQQGQELVAEVQAMAEKVKTLADEHDQKLQALKGDQSDDTQPGDMDTDETGQLKAMRRVYRAVVRRVRGRRRYKLADILKGIEAARNPLAQLDELRRKDPEGWAKVIEPRLRKLKLYGE